MLPRNGWGPRLCHAPPFGDGEELIGSQFFEFFHQPARPADFETFDDGLLSQAKVLAHVVVGEIASAAPDFGALGRIAGLNPQSRANRISIALRSHQAQGDPMILLGVVSVE